MYVMGDTHSILGVIQVLKNKNITNENVIHVGDFGLGFQEIRRDLTNLLELDEFCIENNITFYVQRGNHDYKFFWDGSIKLPKFNNLHLVPDYMRFKIEDKMCLFVGGAISIDRSTRMMDRTWDINEKFILEPELLEEMFGIDYVFTHSAPNFCEPVVFGDLVEYYHLQEKKLIGTDLKAELTEERKQITEMYNILIKNNDIQKWCFGHFHRSSYLNIQHTEFICLNINELKKI